MSKSTRRITKNGDRPTAGELQQKAQECSDPVDPLEVAYARLEGLENNLYECALKHEPLFDEDEFFICLNVAYDNVLSNVRRHKYSAYLFLPQPRPNQSCFLYNRHTQKFTYLWSLPSPHVMAIISEMSYVDKRWEQTKLYCDAFYNKTFWDTIRKLRGIKHLSEHEYLLAHRDELLQAVGDQSKVLGSDSVDGGEVVGEEVVQG